MKLLGTPLKCSDHRTRGAWGQTMELDHYFALSVLFCSIYTRCEYVLAQNLQNLPPICTLIWFGNQINLCVNCCYSPFSSFLPFDCLLWTSSKNTWTPIYTCGTYLVMLVPPPGSGSSATRSLFGGTSGLLNL